MTIYLLIIEVMTGVYSETICVLVSPSVAYANAPLIDQPVSPQEAGAGIFTIERERQ